MTDVYLEDGYRMTLSEVFRVVHDYFGHGILGNQFGAVGEENATLQHLDLYSFEALPAVIFQTRGQNSWVNFSGVNNEALRKIREGSKTNNKNLLKEGQEEFRFATPKDNILPKIFNFKTYETARRINEQEEIRKSETYLDPRGKHEDTNISELLTRQTSRNSGKLNGFSRRSLGVSKRLGGYDVEVIAEYEGNQEIEQLIKNVFPRFKGTQKIYEISNGEVYREMMIEALETNKFKSSVTVHSAEDFSNMRLFVTEDGSTGITLTKDGFLGGAFGNPKAGRPNNLAQMMLLGIKEGALTAEAFDTILPDYYSLFGFKAVSRTAFNEEYRPLKENGALEDWDYELYSRFNNGRPDVVFFIYDGGDRGSIQSRLGQFDFYSDYQKHFTEHYDKDSYSEAYRFMEVEAINKSNYQNQEVSSQMNATEQEIEQIKAQAIAKGTFMKAPNGRPSNLSEEQWITVRTERFKKWFGDWENDPENASKVVDENGEPMVVYHTSDNEFSEFDKNKIGKNYTLRHGNGFYFSSSTLGHSQWGRNTKMFFLNIRNMKKSSLSFREEAKEKGFLNTYDNSVDMTSYAKKIGVDGLFAGDSFNKEFIAFEPNQIKSATDNVGTFDSGINDIRFQILGEQGAAALDRFDNATRRMDNLRVARDMENAGKTAKEILLATGWQRGADGKWKFEIDDNFKYNWGLKADVKFNLGIKVKLSDVLDFPELFEAYPQLKNINFEVRDLGDLNTAGHFNSSTNTIVLNKFTYADTTNEQVVAGRIILHEVQHAIQDIEGFAKGGNKDTVLREAIKQIENVLGREINETILRDDIEGLNVPKDLKDVFLSTFYTENGSKEANISKRGYKLYERLAGEVESRNVERRMNMTPEERRQTLLEETEDVSREDQIIIMGGVDVADGNPIGSTIQMAKDNAQEDASKKGKSSPNNTISISLTPFAGNRIPRYRDMYERITSLLEAGNTKDAQDIINNMREDVLYRLQQLLPDANISTKDINGFWKGSDELSFSIKIDNVTNDTYAAIAKVAEDFDQDAVHILESVEVKDTDVISVKNSDGSAIIPVATFTFEKEMSKAEFAKLLESSGFLGASLSADGMGAVIYYSDTHNTKEEAEEGINNFYNNINKFIDDSKRKYGTFRQNSHAKFTPFNRGGNSEAQGTYEWANSNIHTSDACQYES